MEQPVGNVRLLVTAEPKLWTQTMEMFKRLSGDVIEVGEMADSVKDGKEEGSAGHNLVEDNVGVQRDVLVKGPLLHLGDQVPDIDKQLQCNPLIGQNAAL